ncbi:MAG TPA: hypothetical protein VHM19_23095 [Polyangiales bacterium]|nr:hypothetical protein [Polyangiales bacterium]
MLRHWPACDVCGALTLAELEFRRAVVSAKCGVRIGRSTTVTTIDPKQLKRFLRGEIPGEALYPPRADGDDPVGVDAVDDPQLSDEQRAALAAARAREFKRTLAKILDVDDGEAQPRRARRFGR